MGLPSLAQLALAGVISLIAFLGYGSQYLFRYTQPAALDQRQSLVFNLLLFCTWVCYARACFTDPGHVPRDWDTNASLNRNSDLDAAALHNPVRWCRKCENSKPPRAHHCKVCQRYLYHDITTFHPGVSKVLMESPDVYRRWITIALGPSIASLTAHFPTSSASSFTPSWQCAIWNISSTSALRFSSRIDLFLAYVSSFVASTIIAYSFFSRSK